jgi:hypothetical protein
MSTTAGSTSPVIADTSGLFVLVLDPDAGFELLPDPEP